MKTYNTIYRNKQALFDFINSNLINLEKNILIQVFSGIYSIEFIETLREELLEILPTAKIIGATTGGEIFEGKSQKNTCVISFSTFGNTKISTNAVSDEDTSSYKTGQSLAKKLVKPDTKLLILFSTSESINGEEFLRGIDSVTNGVITSGGMAGKDREFSDAFVFNEKEIILSGAVSAALHNNNLHIYNDYVFGWVPITKPLTITSSKDNTIYTIENQPATEIYEKYLGKEILEGLPLTGYEFPLMVDRNGYPVTRVIVHTSEDGSLTCTANFVEGEKIRFGYGNLKNIIDLNNKALDRINNSSIESIFIYSCAARQIFLASMIDKEMLPLCTSTPLCGFFSFGEFNHVDSKSLFVSQTMTVLGISESSEKELSVDYSLTFSNDDSEIISNKGLYNLIQITVDELNDINSNLEANVKIKTAELIEQFYTDSLTKLPNRIRLIEDLKGIANPKLAIINIDDFREIDEFYGHEAGDSVLVELSKRLVKYGEMFKINVYRLPSDEFGLLADENISLNNFIINMKVLSSLIEKEYFHYLNNELIINVSIGASINEDNLLEKASMALKYAKKHKESFKLYNKDLLSTFGYEKNILWSKKIRNAIEADRIIPYFQPIYNNETEKIEKYEALIRMIDEDGSVISPYQFLNISKKVRLYPRLTMIMINKTFEAFKNSTYSFSINLCVEDILNDDIRNLIKEKLSNKNIATRTVFEIVESEGIESFEEIGEFIDEIHSFGGKVAIDDFGTGYSNFGYLLNLNVDYIKIDGSMIKNIHSDPSSQLITEAIISFASKLGIKAIAEFVHSEEVYKKVTDLGISFSQGYYLGHPKPDLHDSK